MFEISSSAGHVINNFSLYVYDKYLTDCDSTVCKII